MSQLKGGIWAIEIVEIDEITYGVEHLYDNLLSFESNGKGNGFIFRNSPYFSNNFDWEFLNGGFRGKDSINVNNSNNEYFNGSFQLDFHVHEEVHYLTLTSKVTKVKCFKWL